MKVFHDKKQKAEDRHVRDQELEFKVGARRNKLLGLWAAEHLGRSGDAADSYAKEVVASDFDEPGDDDVVRKVMGDFSQAGVAVTEAQLRQKMNELLDVARTQLTTG